MHGHLAAHLDPLGSEPPGDPALEPERLEPQLTPELQARIPAARPARLTSRARRSPTRSPQLARDLLRDDRLRDRAHLRPRGARLAAPGDRVGPLPHAAAARGAAGACSRASSEVEGSSTSSARAFLGQKQFSIEGLDVLVPMLDEAIELAAEAGAHEVVLGMAHRGRLNVLAHTSACPYEDDPARVRGRADDRRRRRRPGGRHRRRQVPPRRRAARADARPGEITVTLAANPSHLEAVDPVVEGRTRAEQTDRSRARRASTTRAVALPILIHGDASFAGQGVVAETLNLQALAGYSTGGTLHLIANNQVGFTTDPARRPLDALLERPREGLRRPDHPRERRRPGGGDLRGPARDGVPAPLRRRRRRSTSSATAATATTSRTSPRTRSR